MSSFCLVGTSNPSTGLETSTALLAGRVYNGAVRRPKGGFAGV
jgi:hypothetical protein